MNASEHNEMRQVNGVFTGGGAKLIAYVGALQATHERGLWFGSVAGSSAGAITAALIAAGMQPDELEAAIPSGFAQLKTSTALRLGRAVAGTATSLFESRGLRSWLDERLAERIPDRAGTGPVTFDELHGATGIELYVVTMDLSLGVPVVFCRRTTPTVEVAGAVAASAAIPGMFPAGRAVFDVAGEGAVVRQLADGSLFANYPSFVFDDRSFRTWLRGEAQVQHGWSDADIGDWDAECARPVVGFVLGEPEPLEHGDAIGVVPLAGPEVTRRFDLGPTFTSPTRATYLFGALLSSDWARLTIGVALAIWVTLSVVVLPLGFRRYATWLALWMPDVLFPVVLVGSLAVVVMAVLVAVASIAVLILAGRLVAETLIPAMKAMLGVPLEVAPWIGLGEDSVVLHVPKDGLHLLDFDVEPAVRSRAIANARQSVGGQLDGEVVRERLAALLAGDTPPSVPHLRGHRLPEQPPAPEGGRWIEALALVVAAVAVGTLAWWATDTAAAERIDVIVLAVGLGFITVVAAVWYVGGRAALRAATEAAAGVGSQTPAPNPRIAQLLVAGGIAAIVAGGVVSYIAMGDRSSGTTEAHVVTAAESSDDPKKNEYTLHLDDLEGLSDPIVTRVTAGIAPGEPVPVEVTSERHLRLGERVFVGLDDNGRAELDGALASGSFAVAVVLWIVGLGLVTSGVRSHRRGVRCRRLGDLVTDWRQV